MRKSILNFYMYAEDTLSLTRSNMQRKPPDFVFVDIVFDFIQYAYVLLGTPKFAVLCL
jgi:hypothetical protein